LKTCKFQRLNAPPLGSVFRRVRRRLFAFVHGVSVVNLWSVRQRSRV
jgi:hypothetical protein